MKRHNQKAHPLLVGHTILGGRQISVWCPHCKREHVHGWDPANKPNDVEHRVAHCFGNESPFIATGYFIGIHPESGR